jgi:hypothetical protein
MAPRKLPYLNWQAAAKAKAAMNCSNRTNPDEVICLGNEWDEEKKNLRSRTPTPAASGRCGCTAARISGSP